jgi:hypothetical protein
MGPDIFLYRDRHISTVRFWHRVLPHDAILTAEKQPFVIHSQQHEADILFCLVKRRFLTHCSRPAFSKAASRCLR